MIAEWILYTNAYITLIFIGYKILTFLFPIVYPYFIACTQNLDRLAGGANWVVITGSTDGIGKAFAFELAENGFNLVLISRTRSKLEATKNEINEAYPHIEIKTIAFDFSNPNLADYEEKLFHVVEDLDVGILVNNVGYVSEYPDVFHKLPGGTKAILDGLFINTVPVTLLTAAVLPQMVERKAGIVINVSSAAAYASFAYWSVYAASKRYVNHLSASLRSEYDTTGITIQTLCPMRVSTKMSKASESWLSPSPKTYVKSALQTVGNIDETTGCLSHQLQVAGFALPHALIAPISNRFSERKKDAALETSEI
uniref:NAD(P)-binding protein n=1 Tax=Panagrellus redivivus TaxID=6233 RepID=A0A7E4VQ60_PANRE